MAAEEMKSEMEKVQAEKAKDEEEDEADSEEEEPYSDYQKDATSQEDDDPSSEDYVPPFEIYYDCDDPEQYKTEEYLAFAKTIMDSRGYDVPPRPSLKIAVNIVPTRDKRTLRTLARIAIKIYNKRYETEYVFDHVIKGNKQPARGILYYITFVVAGSDAKPHEFEALVLYGVSAITVYECHPKAMPATSSTSPATAH